MQKRVVGLVSDSFSMRDVAILDRLRCAREVSRRNGSLHLFRDRTGMHDSTLDLLLGALGVSMQRKGLGLVFDCLSMPEVTTSELLRCALEVCRRNGNLYPFCDGTGMHKSKLERKSQTAQTLMQEKNLTGRTQTQIRIQPRHRTS